MITTAQSRRRGTFAIVCTFAVVCPPVAIAAYLGLVALSEMAVQRFPSLEYREIVWFALLYGIPFGYVLLIWPAALAGLVIARWQAVKGRVRWWLALAIGVVLGAVGQLAFGGGMQSSRGGSGYWPIQELVPTAAFAVSIMVAWTIVRNWYVSPPATGSPP
jgi:hypothetical protein